jgi:hypothetical protein
MKKWLIFAAVAAMFAVVMFPACETGGDDAGIADSVNVEALFDEVAGQNGYSATASLIGYNITWEGVPGYDYYAYFEVMDARGDIQRATTQVKGQTVYKFGKKTSGSTLDAPFIMREEADGKESWSILACAATFGPDAVGPYTAATTSSAGTWTTSGTGGYSGDVNLTTPDHGSAVANALWTALVAVNGKDVTYTSGKIAAQFRIAVVPANPGGFPFEDQRTVRYSDWQKATLNVDGKLVSNEIVP